MFGKTSNHPGSRFRAVLGRLRGRATPSGETWRSYDAEREALAAHLRSCSVTVDPDLSSGRLS